MNRSHLFDGVDVNRPIRWGAWALAGLSCVMICGCMNNPQMAIKQDKPAMMIPDPMPVSDIVSVNKFFSPVPWLIFEDQENGTIDGFKCTVYLEGRDSGKGVFVTGTIVVTMYRLDQNHLGREVATKIYEWNLTREKARPWRARKPTMLGWGYGLRLNWGKDIDVAGRKIAIVIKYVPKKGPPKTSSRKVLRVPLTGDTSGQISRRKRM